MFSIKPSIPLLLLLECLLVIACIDAFSGKPGWSRIGVVGGHKKRPSLPCLHMSISNPVRLRIGLNQGQYLVGGPDFTKEASLGRMYDIRKDSFSNAQIFVVPKSKEEELIIEESDSSSYGKSDLVGTGEYENEVTDAGGSLGVNYGPISVEGEGLYNEANSDSSTKVAAYQFEYKTSKRFSLNQDILQGSDAYTSQEYIAEAAKGGKIDDYVETYGRHYISDVYVGVAAVRKVTFDFGSTEAKRQIEAEAKGEIGVGALTVKFAGHYSKTDESGQTRMNIEVEKNTIGGEPRDLEIDWTGVDFGDPKDVDKAILSSWKTFFDNAKDENYGVLALDLNPIGSAIISQYSMTRPELDKLEKHIGEARNRIVEVNQQKLSLDFRLKRVRDRLNYLGGSEAGAINEILRKLDAPIKSFQNYQLDVVDENMRTYLAGTQADILSNDVPPLGTMETGATETPSPDSIDYQGAKLSYASMKEVYEHLDGSVRVPFKLGTGQDRPNALWDGPVVDGKPVGVPNVVSIFENDIDVETLSTAELNTQRVLQIYGNNWDPFRDTPLPGAVAQWNVAAEDVRYDKLPDFCRTLDPPNPGMLKRFEAVLFKDESAQQGMRAEMFEFAAFDSEKPGTVQFSVGTSESPPGRYGMIERSASMEHDGWHHEYSFWAYPSPQIGTIGIALIEEQEPNKATTIPLEYFDQTAIESFGAKHKLDFWVYPADSASKLS